MNLNFTNKKAAMFGLDARIALAIFGALSVISGAALYSAIKEAKNEQWRQYFEELIKASEQYYLDNGQQTPIQSTTYYHTYISDLANNRENLSTWNGPYWNTSAAVDAYIKDNMTAQLHADSQTRIYLRQASTWSQMNDTTVDEFCVVNSSDCSEWITLVVANASKTSALLALFNDLDELIDGGDGKLTGKVRYNDFSADYLMYQGILRKRIS